MVPATEEITSAKMLRKATMQPRLVAAVHTYTRVRPWRPTACVIAQRSKEW